MLATNRGHVPMVKALLLAGAAVDAVDGAGYSALMLAAGHGHAEVVDALLARGASGSLAGNGGATALMLAAFNGHAEVVRLLLQAGTDQEARDDSGQSALMLARQFGHAQIAAMLEPGARGPEGAGSDAVVAAAAGRAGEVIDLTLAPEPHAAAAAPAATTAPGLASPRSASDPSSSSITSAATLPLHSGLNVTASGPKSSYLLADSSSSIGTCATTACARSEIQGDRMEMLQDYWATARPCEWDHLEASQGHGLLAPGRGAVLDHGALPF